MTQLHHTRTGKTALVQKLPRGLLLAQFDDRRHPHAYGWHLYCRHEFRKLYNKGGYSHDRR